MTLSPEATKKTNILRSRRCRWKVCALIIWNLTLDYDTGYTHLLSVMFSPVRLRSLKLSQDFWLELLVNPLHKFHYSTGGCHVKIRSPPPILCIIWMLFKYLKMYGFLAILLANLQKQTLNKRRKMNASLCGCPGKYFTTPYMHLGSLLGVLTPGWEPLLP